MIYLAQQQSCRLDECMIVMPRSSTHSAMVGMIYVNRVAELVQPHDEIVTVDFAL